MELEAFLQQLIAEYHYCFGGDKEFDNLMNKIMKWEQVKPLDYGEINQIKILNEKKLVMKKITLKTLKKRLGN